MNVDLIPIDGTANCLEDPHMMTESSIEDNNYVGFKSNNLCLDAICVEHNGHDTNLVSCRMKTSMLK